jgi:hypothetical protein
VLRRWVRMGIMSLLSLQKGWWPHEAGAILNNKKCTKILTLFRFQLAMESIEPTLKYQTSTTSNFNKSIIK